MEEAVMGEAADTEAATEADTATRSTTTITEVEAAMEDTIRDLTAGLGEAAPMAVGGSGGRRVSRKRRHRRRVRASTLTSRSDWAECPGLTVKLVLLPDHPPVAVTTEDGEDELLELHLDC